MIAVTHRLSSVTSADWIFRDASRPHRRTGPPRPVDRRRWTLQLEHVAFRRQSGVHVTGVDANWLKEMPLFQSVDPSTLSELAGLFATEQIPEDRDIIREGDPATASTFSSTEKRRSSRAPRASRFCKMATTRRNRAAHQPAAQRHGPQHDPVRLPDPAARSFPRHGES